VIQLPDKALIGMVHLPALPGTAHDVVVRSADPLESIIEQATREALILAEAGFDAIIVENFGDAPFRATNVEPHTVAAMTRCVRAVVQACGLPVGVNVLRNDPLAALAVAFAAGAQAIRVNVHTGVYATDQGIIEGQAAQTLQYRRQLGADLAIWADVHVKHARPLSEPDIALAAEELVERGKADAVIVSGSTTGRSADTDEVKRAKAAVPDCPVLVGSGVNPDNVKQFLRVADGVIVGSSLKLGGKASAALDPERARRLVNTARS
jgi:membrane complex biogenesis BtpA family protein